MKTMDTGIAALTRLDKTPEQVLAHKRAELEEQIRVLQQKTWFECYADWRIKQTKTMLGEGENYEELKFSLGFRLVELLCIAVMIAPWKVLPTIGLVVLVVIEVGHLILFAGIALEEKNAKVFIEHMFYSLILPLMPLIIVEDIKIGKSDRNWELRDKREQIMKLQREHAALTPHQVVPDYYADGIRAARDELLGESSELRKAERELLEHLEKIKADKVTFDVRVKAAGDDLARVDVLMSYLEQLKIRESNLASALERHQVTISKTHAILDECERFVNKLPDKLMDEQLIRESQAREAGESLSIQKAQEAVNQHVDLVRDRLMQLAAIVAAPQHRPLTSPNVDMQIFFAHLDKVAEKVATLEAQKAF